MSGGAVAVRAAGPADLALLAELGERTYREHFSALWSAAGIDAFVARHFAPAELARELGGDEVRYLLAFDGDAAVGFAKAIRDQPVPTRPEQRGLELQKIYFTRAAVGRGHGAATLDRVLTLARSLGEPCVWLDVLKSNQGATRFYERHGFARIGELPFASDLGVDIGMWVLLRSL